MKKYWKTIVISLVIVVTISSYYIQLAWASKDEIALTLETVSGNKEELNNLMIQGSYDTGGIYRQFNLLSGSMQNQENRSFIQNLTTPYAPFPMQNYIEQHRNFMRGKGYNLSQYVEDDTRLIYATIPDTNRLNQGGFLTIQIDMLDKNTNDRTTFEVKTTTKVRYSWTNVYDVHVENEQVKILVMYYLTNGDEELHVYTVNVKNQELEDNTMIAQSKSENSYISINFNDEIENSNYYVYQVGEYSDETEDDSSQKAESQVYVYHISTSEVEELVIPAELKPFTSSILVQDEDIILPVQSADAIEVYRYNMEQQQWEEPVSFTIQRIVNDDQEPFIRFMDDKLYSVYQASEGYRLLIGDVRTGKSLYEGNIVNKDNVVQTGTYTMYIDQIYNLD